MSSREIQDNPVLRVFANRLLLWVQICEATGCFVKALPMGKNIVLDKSYTKQLGQISILEHCKRDFRKLKSTRNKDNKF